SPYALIILAPAHARSRALAPRAPSRLPLHDALPLFVPDPLAHADDGSLADAAQVGEFGHVGVHRLFRVLQDKRRHLLLGGKQLRSEEHTSELQSRGNIVCRLLLEKQKCVTTRLARSP